MGPMWERLCLNRSAGGINNTGDSNPSYLTAFGATLFFAADDGTTNGRELWKSNGTDAGTQMAFNLNPNNNAGSNPTYITNANGVLCLAANNGTTGNELWESDGTLAGTSVYNINPSLLGAGSDPQNLTNVNDTLYFTADNGAALGRELFALKHNTAPVISSIEDQETYDNNPIKTEFSISDAQTPAKNLTLTVTSNNQTLLPNANIKLEGTGEARTLTLTPAANKTGTCIVTIVVRDPKLGSAQRFNATWFPAQVVANAPGPGIDFSDGNIKQAVLAAISGEIVLVKDGTYSGDGVKDISPKDGSIIRSENGPEKAIIDLQYSGRAFDFNNVSATLDGFTIKNGYITPAGTTITTQEYGSAIYVHGSAAKPLIKNCRFLYKTSLGCGGAIAVQYSGAYVFLEDGMFIKEQCE